MITKEEMRNLRDYALITLMKTFRRMELLDEKRNNNEEITKLRHFIGQFVHRTMQSDNPPDEDINLIDKYPEILEIADEKDEEKANSLTKKLLQTYRKELIDSTSDYQKISEGDYEKVMINAAAVYEQVFKPEIDAHNNNRRNKNNQIGKTEFVSSLIKGEVDDDIAHLVLNAKKRVMEEIKNRQFTPDEPNKRAFQQDLNDLLPGLTIEYPDKGNTAAVQQANAKVRSYFSAADAKNYRDKYPEDETARRIAPGSKEDFLKMLGSLAQAGYLQVHKDIEPNKRTLNETYTSFRNILIKNYPNEDPERLIAKVLGVPENLSTEETDKRCLEAFAEKGASVYTQMLGGFIQLRADTFPNEPINESVVSALKIYIDGMSQGIQDIKTLALIIPDKEGPSLSERQENKLAQKIKKEQAGQQHVNVDHINPVASAITLYLKAHPEEGGELDPNKLRLPKLLKLAEKAYILVDNIANHRQVIGRKVNDQLEAHGSYVLTQKRDNSIVATSYSSSKIKEIISKWGAGINKERYMEAFDKYTKSDSRGIITTTLNLPENSDVARLREQYAPKKNALDLRVILEKIPYKQK